MEIQIKLNNTSFTKTDEAFTLDTPKATLTIEEIITEKVRHEVNAFNQKVEESVKTIGEVTDTEAALNRKVNKLRLRPEDFEKQCYVALEGFTQNRFFVYVNDQQYFHLNDIVLVEPTMEVTFIKITPLIGG